MHRLGMVNMINVRGGISNVQRNLQMKIYRYVLQILGRRTTLGNILSDASFRAGINGAVDALSQPLLPRPQRSVPSIYDSISVDSDPRALLSILMVNKIGPRFLNLLLDLSCFSEAIERALR